MVNDKSQIGLTDIARGRATSEQSRNLIVEIIENHLPNSEQDLFFALQSRVFKLIYNHEEKQEVLEWYDIVRATGSVLRNREEISTKLGVLSDLLQGMISAYKAEATRSEPVYQQVAWLQNLEEDLGLAATRMYWEEGLLERFGLVQTRISMLLDRGLDAESLVDGRGKLWVGLGNLPGKGLRSIARWYELVGNQEGIDLEDKLKVILSDVDLSQSIQEYLLKKILADILSGKYIPHGFSLLKKGSSEVWLKRIYEKPDFT